MKKTIRSILALALPMLWVIPTLAAPSGDPTLFKDGTRWLAIGDSITQDNKYQQFVYLFLATRFPDRDLAVLNAGIAGDTADGALQRYAWDIAPQRATAATVMFGMNDIDRNLYAPGEATPQILQQREAALNRFRTNLTALVAKLQSDGVRVTLVTPSPFDDTAQLATPNLPGCNDGLARCANIARQIAAKFHTRSVDLHGPMTTLNQAGQQDNPASTLIGNDRVHPGTTGHLVMAALLLKDCDAPAVVSDVAINAKKLQIIHATNATITGLAREKGGVQFIVHARSLPFPADPKTRLAMELTDFTDSLNREMLQVTGLPDGEYQLAIEGQVIRKFTGRELANGVNLAVESATPQNLQARNVADLITRWGKRMDAGLRRIAQVDGYHFRDLPHPVNFESVREAAKQKLATVADQKSYSAMVLRTYLEEKPKAAETAAEIESLAKQIHAAAQPRPLTYEIVPTS
jgi:lysophospholipase L1-like esterase